MPCYMYYVTFFVDLFCFCKIRCVYVCGLYIISTTCKASKPIKFDPMGYSVDSNNSTK